MKIIRKHLSIQKRAILAQSKDQNGSNRISELFWPMRNDLPKKDIQEFLATLEKRNVSAHSQKDSTQQNIHKQKSPKPQPGHSLGRIPANKRLEENAAQFLLSAKLPPRMIRYWGQKLGLRPF